MIAFKPVPLMTRLDQATQPLPQMPLGPVAAPPSTPSRKTLPMVLSGASALLSGAAAWGNSGRVTEGQKTMFMITAVASALSAAAFLFFLLAPE